MKQLQSRMRIKKFYNLFYFLCLILTIQYWSTNAFGQEKYSADTIISLKYFNEGNLFHYLLLQCKSKSGKKSEPIPGVHFKVYLDSSSSDFLINELTSDVNGKAKYTIPPRLQSIWNASTQHTFIAIDEKNEAVSDLTILKSKIEIDTITIAGARNIVAKFFELKNNEWIGVSDVEMKIGILRLGGGILSAGDVPTYSTDSSGIAQVEYKWDSLPGNEKGNIVIVAKVEDNDLYGNLMVSKIVPWGKAFRPSDNFFKLRTLWTTRFRTPYWLLFMAYTMVIGVWGTLLYLFNQLIKLIKLGKD
jgi:hypothetical protein